MLHIPSQYTTNWKEITQFANTKYLHKASIRKKTESSATKRLHEMSSTLKTQSATGNHFTKSKLHIN